MNTYHHPSVAKGAEASQASSNRIEAGFPRESSLCAAGTALVKKCEAVAAYRNVIEGVEAENSESSLSHQDRVDEWRVTQMALCVVNLLADENYDIDDAALFNCDETTMSFHEGSTWEVAEPSLSSYVPVSANFRHVQTYQPKLNLADEDAPFAPEEGLCQD